MQKRLNYIHAKFHSGSTYGSDFAEGGVWESGGEESASPPGYKTAKLPGLGKVKKLLLMFLAIFQRIR